MIWLIVNVVHHSTAVPYLLVACLYWISQVRIIAEAAQTIGTLIESLWLDGI